MRFGWRCCFCTMTTSHISTSHNSVTPGSCASVILHVYHIFHFMQLAEYASFVSVVVIFGRQPTPRKCAFCMMRPVHILLFMRVAELSAVRIVTKSRNRRTPRMPAYSSFARHIFLFVGFARHKQWVIDRPINRNIKAIGELTYIPQKLHARQSMARTIFGFIKTKYLGVFTSVDHTKSTTIELLLLHFVTLYLCKK